MEKRNVKKCRMAKNEKGKRKIIGKRKKEI
jgi:hypothetical protein